MGKLVVSFKYDELLDYSEGFAAFKLDGYWGFIDDRYYPIFDNHFYKVDSFCEGVAPVQHWDWGSGYINHHGTIAIPPSGEIWFDEGYKFSEGVAWVNCFGFLHLIDITGKCVSDTGWEFMIGETFLEGLAAINPIVGCGGFVNKNLKIIVPFIYEKCKLFKQGLAPVKQEGKWGFINQFNKTILPFIYDEVDEFCCGLALVKCNNHFGFIDKKGTQYWED